MSSERARTGRAVGDGAGAGNGEEGTGDDEFAVDADGGYVHRPDGPPESPDGVGWTLVAVVVLAFLVIPGVIYLRPATPGEFGFGFLVSMLVLPMVPAALLGATAVWSAVRDRGD
ncbi:hypothetical protein [Halorarum halobium]|uniref:hypothetical protein n=1 Tax=Halorarum halobium TaxID=3075121 RepID=UPI0028AFB992|nr:hypothetical protein [Halobaculum sp. XH14]